MGDMQTATFDWEEEAKAAELLVVYLGKVEAPQKLIDQARKRAMDVRKVAGLEVKTEI